MPSILRGQTEIAEYLGVTPRTLRRWLRSERPPPVSCPGRRQYVARPEHLDRWMFVNMDRTV